MPSSYRITIVVEFPGGDPHARPQVRNSRYQQDRIPDSVDRIEWHLTTAGVIPPNADNLKITGLQFFRPGQPDMIAFPPCLKLNNGIEGNPSGRNWVIDFTDTEVPQELQFAYGIKYQTNDHPDLDWDPTIKIDPRGGGTGEPDKSVTPAAARTKPASQPRPGELSR